MARQWVGTLLAARNEAALKIQTMFRQRRARIEAWRQRQRRNAAIHIQRVWRGYLGRARASRERDRYLFRYEHGNLPLLLKREG